MTEDTEIVIGGDAEDIPPGTYRGKLVRLGTAESNEYGTFKTWDFVLDTGSQVGGASSLNSGPRSKLYRWATALGLKKGESLSSAIGRDCLVVVGLNKDNWPTVTDVLPPMAKGAESPVAASPGAPGTPLPNQVEPDLPF